MAVSSKEADSVKLEISSGTASLLTVTTLQGLLALNDNTSATKNPNQAKNTSVAKTAKVSRTTRTGSQKSKKQPDIDILADNSSILSGKERYALATEIVNISLKALTNATRVTSRKSKLSEPAENASSTSSSPKCGSKQPLQEQSGNITPSPASGRRKRTIPSDDECTSEPGPDQSGISIAECARLAFTYLRGVDTKKLGVRDLPDFQLESGMVALAGKLLTLGFNSMAARELRIVKRRLDSKTAKCAKVASNGASSEPEKETLASLLQLEADFHTYPDALSLAISYQLTVLKLLAVSKKPSAIEAASYILLMPETNSPAVLIQRNAQRSKDYPKAAKQMEQLSQIILGLCPSISGSTDTNATDTSISVSPSTSFKLQVTALKLREAWWKLAGHTPDIQKELLEPFSKCLSAVVRRMTRPNGECDLYTVASEAYEDLVICNQSNNSDSAFSSQQLLATLAEMCRMPHKSSKWVTDMAASCATLPRTHARKVACIIKAASLKLKSENSVQRNVMVNELTRIKQALEVQIEGQCADYTFLLGELAQLLNSLTTVTKSKEESNDVQTIVSLAATFAQRYVRSWPGRGASQAQSIIMFAVRHTKSTNDLASWISTDAAKLFIASGMLNRVALAADRCPMNQARAVNSAAITFERIVRALTLKAIKSEGAKQISCLVDDEKLPAVERATLAEWQLSCAMEFTSHHKYGLSLRKIFSELFERLARFYNILEHPIRRARIYTSALHLRQSNPGLVSGHILEAWKDTESPNITSLGSDDGLSCFVDDVSASLEIAKLFDLGRPSAKDLKPSLLVWYRLVSMIDGSKESTQKLENCLATTTQLRSIASYLVVIGDEIAAIPVLILALAVSKMSKEGEVEGCAISIELASIYLDLGYSEKAGYVLAEAHDHVDSASAILRLQYLVAYAEYYTAIDNLDKAVDFIEQTQKLRSTIRLESIHRDDRRTFELLHGRAWLVHSNYLMSSGVRQEALSAAKRAARILNSVWSAMEHSSAPEEPQKRDEHDISTITTGISKLRLKPVLDASKSPKAAGNNDTGAQFWPLLPLICKTLLHLSSLYIHHGLYLEADYYSNRAVQVSSSVGTSNFALRINTQRSLLLAMAGKLEDAEMCLEGCEQFRLEIPTLLNVNICIAKAAIRAREGSFDEAKELYGIAHSVIDTLKSPKFAQSIELIQHEEGLLENSWSSKSAEEYDKPKSRTSRKPATTAPRSTSARSTTRVASRTATSRKINTTKAAAPPEADPPQSPTKSYLLDKLKADLLMRKAIISLRLGEEIDDLLSLIKPLCSTTFSTLSQRRLLSTSLMRKASTAMQSDFSLNVLQESTLSYPALLNTTRKASDQSQPKSSVILPSQGPVSKKIKSANARNGREATQIASFGNILEAANECMIGISGASQKFCGTSIVHSEGSLLADITMLLSATGLSSMKSAQHPVRQALNLDLPSIHAARCEIGASSIGARENEQSNPLQWPTIDEMVPFETLDASKFQEEYVDTLPETWTAVSLRLNDDMNELYVTRYRCGQSPFILRLPFSRHKPESVDEEEDTFDYAKGKAELEEIIEVSNHSCHNTSGMESKGAKKNWWSEREALDKRMHELLINIENIWLGGFRSVLSLHPRQPDLLARFRKSFDDILARYLPSRQATKGSSKRLILDSKVLELFVGLGKDNDGEIDLDEPLADLLYFVVDMLQFSGEQNAYDEIDFDSMIVDVLEALRAYHESCSDLLSEDQHMILVLDRRLQAFPWESLPCLEGASVSRVSSLLTIKERLDEMRQQNLEKPFVDRASGTYILNPSSDLKGTQEMLSPHLSRLAEADNSEWSSIVNIAPDEGQFTSALTNSGMLLYFGHGAGSQYIRPRTIKSLEKCSKVVWLMGCSSGAVTEYGELEPFAVPLSYLLAGQAHAATEPSKDNKETKCMSVVATLWDVTDKDIDRFSLAVGEEWGLFEPSEASKLPAKTPKKREQFLTPSTPQQSTKTPATPKVHKTPAPAKTPSRSRSRSKPGVRTSEQPRSLVAAVSRSRDACYLRYLNGAAAVVYGVPVYLRD
ncbi:Hypothetical protein R9X50_00090000 [Acrodontium crateriforme]|uniref:Separase n=1 Tax=Acrodontium crateriforme TaxID=150365 RepID=A0AAQ3LZQ0_9PEZI|nr:Hypothetical protein R9X50_00090000 [Acrodontium crateriforme]